MTKIIKQSSGKTSKPFLDQENIKIGGNAGVNVEATPRFVKAQGGIRFNLRLPTFLAFNLFRKIAEHLNRTQNNG